MKKICASQTATAICLSIDIDTSPPFSPSSSSSAFLLTTSCGSALDRGGAALDRGGAAIDRHNPIIRDLKRIPKSLPPCTDYSQPPIIPKSQKIHQYKKKMKNGKIPFKENEDDKIKDGVVKKIWKCTNPGDFISPPGSTRYLLRENFLSDATSSDFDPSGGKELPEISRDLKRGEGFLIEEKSESSSHHSPEQVVVLRVSLHCRGCERKLRKHLSRLEGVKSYNIEFASKKVTVTGNVTPLGVLTSICKVKNAQLWSPTLSSSEVIS
ncbi:hypothetical protein OROGR_029493 [Orobanche gracilis]